MVRKSPIGKYLRQINAPDWMKGQKNAITPDVANELEALGFTIPDWVTILPYDSEEMKSAIYVCRAIEEGHPESLADNVVGKCAFCSTRIEYRPSAPAEITKVCSKCAEAKATSPEN